MFFLVLSLLFLPFQVFGLLYFLHHVARQGGRLPNVPSETFAPLDAAVLDAWAVDRARERIDSFEVA